MKYPLRILIVEDTESWRKALRGHLLDRFNAYPHYRRVEIDTAEDGDQALALLERQNGSDSKYDLVVLDIDLGVGSSGAPTPSGLDVLVEIAKRDAAFFVAFVTGAITDPTLADRFGQAAAAVIQVELQCEAAKHFPPERIRVVNKPPVGPFAKQWSAVVAALTGVIESFEYAAAWRYVFRPTKKNGKIWELRWNGGDFIRIPDKAGFAELHYILKHVDQDEELSVVEMMNKVQETLLRKRSGGRRRHESVDLSVATKDQTVKPTFIFGELLHTLVSGWESKTLDEDTLSQIHEFVGTRQFGKLSDTVRKLAATQEKLAALANTMIGIIADAKLSSREQIGNVRLVPRAMSKVAESADKNHESMLGAFRQQRRRLQAKLVEVGLSDMATHFTEAIDWGERNPGRSAYNINRAVRWVLE